MPVLIILLHPLPVLVALKILREILSFGCLENSVRKVKQFCVIPRIASGCLVYCSSIHRDSRSVTQQTLRLPNGLARMAFKSSSVINLFIVIRQTKQDSNAVYSFSDPTTVGCFFALSLPLSADSASINISTIGKQDVLKQTRICYIVRL